MGSNDSEMLMHKPLKGFFFVFYVCVSRQKNEGFTLSFSLMIHVISKFGASGWKLEAP